MIQLIVSIFKYSALVIVILVLSHIIQIKGVTLSRHVENAMSWVSGVNPSKNISESVSDIRDGVKRRTENLNQTAEFSAEDQKQLNQVIQKAQQKRK